MNCLRKEFTLQGRARCTSIAIISLRFLIKLEMIDVFAILMETYVVGLRKQLYLYICTGVQGIAQRQLFCKKKKCFKAS